MTRLAVALLVLASLAGCASSTRAPVVERTRGVPPANVPSAPVATSVPAASPSPSTAASAETYTVKRGDTLYSIALDNGHDYREIAAWNGLSDPNSIREGQVLAMKPPPSDVQVRPIGPAAGVQVRPLTGPDPVRPSVPAGEPLVTEPKPLKLPYSEENLALISKPRPAAPAEARPPGPSPAPIAKSEEPARP